MHEKDTAIKEHQNTFNKIITYSLNTNMKIDENDKAQIFLMLLPLSYNHVVTTILYSKQTFKMKNVMSTLLSKMIRMHSNAGENGADMIKHNTEGRKGRSNVTPHTYISFVWTPFLLEFGPFCKY